MWKEVSKHSVVAPAAALSLVAASMAVLMIGEGLLDGGACVCC